MAGSVAEPAAMENGSYPRPPRGRMMIEPGCGGYPTPAAIAAVVDAAAMDSGMRAPVRRRPHGGRPGLAIPNPPANGALAPFTFETGGATGGERGGSNV